MKLVINRVRAAHTSDSQTTDYGAKGFPGPAGQRSTTALSIKMQNVRKLAAALLKQIELIGVDDQRAAVGQGVPAKHARPNLDFYAEVRRFETELIVSALTLTDGHQVRAAHMLGLKVTTLNAKIKRYNIT